MKNTAFKTIESTGKSIILILDKVGVIGEALSLELSKDFQIVFVSKRIPSKQNEKVFFIPFKSKIPKVPNALYSKIFIVDDGDKITRESISTFVERAQQTNSQIYFIGSIRNVDVSHANEIVSSYQRSKVLIFGDLFDNETFFDSRSSINRYIYQVRKNKRIYIEGDGLSLSYPILFRDTIKLIIKATFIDVKQKVILLFYQHPITDMSLAHTFQKIDPDITADFVESGGERNMYFPRGAEFALSKYDLKKKISEINFNQKNKEKLDSGKRKRGKGIKFARPIIFFLFACLFLFSLPLIATTVYSFLGIKQIEGARISAEEGDFAQALQKSKNAKTFFSVAKRTSVPLETQARIVGLENQAQEINLQIETGEELSTATYSLLSGGIKLKNIYDGDSPDARRDFSDAMGSFKSAYFIIQKAKAQGQIPKALEEKINNMLPAIELLSNSSEVAPGVLGFESSKRYLVLFQNNKELRPGGGVIDAVGVVTINNGKVSEFEILKTNDLDSKLKNHVEPAYGLRRYLPIKDLYLKDNNFDPDFVNNAISAATIYRLQSKNDVDGVIAVDFDFLKNLLKITGPVNARGVGVVNYGNVDEISWENSSDQMQALIIALQEKLGENKNPRLISIAELIGKSLEEKNILFAVKDTDAQNIFTANNLSGTLVDSRKVGPINDYFGISEANLGKNKINDLISRSVSKKLIINDEGEVSSVATISFKNNAPKGAGDYKNYLQIILPDGARIQEVSIGGKILETIPAVKDYLIYERAGYRAPSQLEIEQRIENGKTVFGFLINVSPEAVKTVKITYSLPFKIAKTTKPIDYSLLIYKQPGVESFLFDQTFQANEAFSVMPTNTVSEEIRKDTELQFTLTQR